MNLHDYYEQEGLWGKAPEGPEADRVARTLELIPEGVESVLDVGCGDGRLTNRLAETGRAAVGLDMSREALSHVRVPRVLGSCDRLPFPARSFDLVLCSEVLEHLPPAVYDRTRAELSRVAYRYVIVGTPFREQLKERFTRCPVCATTYHVYRHLRSFDVVTFADLLPGFHVERHRLCGDLRVPRSSLELRLRQDLGGAYPAVPTSVCPVCDHRGASATSWTPLAVLGEGLYRVRRRMAKPTAHWVVALLSRGSSPPEQGGPPRQRGTG